MYFLRFGPRACSNSHGWTRLSTQRHTGTTRTAIISPVHQVNSLLNRGTRLSAKALQCRRRWPFFQRLDSWAHVFPQWQTTSLVAPQALLSLVFLSPMICTIVLTSSFPYHIDCSALQARHNCNDGGHLDDVNHSPPQQACDTIGDNIHFRLLRLSCTELCSAPHETD